MKTANFGVVPLKQACLCLDCEMITAASTSCPACGSGALMNVARALSRPSYGGLLHANPAGIPKGSTTYVHNRRNLAAQTNQFSPERSNPGIW